MKSNKDIPELRYQIIARRLDLEKGTLDELGVELTNLTHVGGIQHWRVVSMVPHAGHLLFLMERTKWERLT